MDKPTPALLLAPVLAAQAACGATAPLAVAPAPVVVAPAPVAALPAPLAALPDVLPSIMPLPEDAASPAPDAAGPEPPALDDPTRCEPGFPLADTAWSGSETTATTDAEPASGASSPAGDPLDASTIRSVVRSHADGFMGCYQLGLGRDPHLQGRVTTRFDIDARGKVSDWTIAANELPDCGVIECIRDHFISIEFPPPGNAVTVLYPLVFGQAN